jgi:hypothetical protein
MESKIKNYLVNKQETAIPKTSSNSNAKTQDSVLQMNRKTSR